MRDLAFAGCVQGMSAGCESRREPVLQSVTADDFEELAAIRVEAMRDSLERLGRFDVERARERLRATFDPAVTCAIVLGGMRIGFYALRPAADGWHLDHLYVRPAFQGRGVGGWVMARVLAEAERAGQPLKVTALKESASNRFYQRHGFIKAGEGDWDIYYVRVPHCNAPFSGAAPTPDS